MNGDPRLMGRVERRVLAKMMRFSETPTREPG
jgi:hypothetical protein